jgi:hypothetical protein
VQAQTQGPKEQDSITEARNLFFRQAQLTPKTAIAIVILPYILEHSMVAIPCLKKCCNSLCKQLSYMILWIMQQHQELVCKPLQAQRSSQWIIVVAGLCLMKDVGGRRTLLSKVNTCKRSSIFLQVCVCTEVQKLDERLTWPALGSRRIKLEAVKTNFARVGQRRRPMSTISTTRDASREETYANQTEKMHQLQIP